MIGTAGIQVLAGGGPRLILDLPGACFLPEHEPYVSAIFRHILEDPVTLQAAMEAEIRNTLAARGSQANAAEGDSTLAHNTATTCDTLTHVCICMVYGK